TARARRVLERGRDLLGRLRPLADTFPAPADSRMDQGDPLATLYRRTVAMADSALRTVLLFPDGATAQLQLCEGLEATLDVVDARLATLAHGIGQRREQQALVERLASLLTALDSGQAVPV